VNVMLPSIAVAAAVCVTRMASLGDRAVVPFSACVVCALPGLAGSVRSDRFFLTPDTRTLARTFIERTVPDGSSLLVQPYSVQLRPSHASLVEALRTNLGSETAASVKFQYELDAPVAPPAYRVVYLGDHTDRGSDPDKLFLSPHDAGGPTGLEPLRARHLAYVVLKRYNDPGSSFAPLLSALEREGHRIATFSPYRSDAGAERRAAAVPFEHNKAMPIDAALERPGPTIEIWVIP